MQTRQRAAGWRSSRDRRAGATKTSRATSADCIRIVLGSLQPDREVLQRALRQSSRRRAAMGAGVRGLPQGEVRIQRTGAMSAGLTGKRRAEVSAHVDRPGKRDPHDGRKTAADRRNRLEVLETDLTQFRTSMAPNRRLQE